MKKQVLTFFTGIVASLLLAGCTTTPNPSVSGGGGPSPSKTPSFLYSDQTYQWDSDGFSTRDGEHILFVGTDNVVKKNFTPAQKSWPDIPAFLRGQRWDESVCSYSWNESYVLVCFETGGEGTRIAQAGDRLSLINAVLYTTDGAFVKAFPVSGADGVSITHDPFESSVSQTFNKVQWVADEIFAINTQARIYLYHIGLDELRLVADFSNEVQAGWTVYNANAFGSRDGWAANGGYYYTVASGNSPDGFEQYDLYRVDWDNDPVLLSGDTPHLGYWNIDGTVTAYDTRLETPEQGDPYSVYDFFWLNDTGDFQAFGVSNWDWRLCGRDGLVGYVTVQDPLVDGQPNGLINTFHCYDTVSGKETTFSPILDASQLPESGDTRFISLLTVDRDGSNIRFFYQIDDQWEMVNNSETPSSRLLYAWYRSPGREGILDTDGAIEYPPHGSPLPCFLEHDKGGRMRIRTLFLN